MTIHSVQQVEPAQFGKVAVLMGGWSAEREISLQSGAAVYAALIAKGINAIAIDVNKKTILSDLTNGDFDIAFNVLHGPGGEDGLLQGLLEVIELPYTGSGIMASALAMDKLRTKQVLQGAGLPTPKYHVLDDSTDLNYVAADLGIPLIVKPCLEGSSIGISRVDDESDLLAAYELAAQFDGEVIAEEWISGKEYTVGILNNKALPVIWLETPRTFFDFEAKYEADDTQYHCPSGLNAEQEAELQRLAVAAFNSVGAESWGRVDILCDEEMRPYIIELNTIPGMTSHSLVPMAAKECGIEFDELVYRILLETYINTNVKENKIGGANVS